MGGPRYGGPRTELGGRGVCGRISRWWRRRRRLTGDQLLGLAEGHAGEALAEAREEGDDAVEEKRPRVVRRLGPQEAAGEQEIKRDAEDGADERLVEPEPAQQRPADLEVDCELAAAEPLGDAFLLRHHRLLRGLQR